MIRARPPGRDFSEGKVGKSLQIATVEDPLAADRAPKVDAKASVMPAAMQKTLRPIFNGVPPNSWHDYSALTTKSEKIFGMFDLDKAQAQLQDP